MNRDEFRGASRHLKGRVQTAIGGLTGDPVRQVRGAANQVAGGAQYTYGRARDQAEDLIDDGRHLAREARERAEHFTDTARERAESLAGTARERADGLVEDGRHAARAVHRRGQAYGERAARYAEGHRTNTLIGLAALAFAAGWLVRRSR
ncbi:CsbD family protein [Methylobacterium platani]|uniref:General stress protein CsbD n=2 Tax=Methylobacterium platani TaxID=427683 RepID=A0A179S3Q3_9HYPH|nr:CsbD family protein [Methylobacterium platani]KMO11779.1 general stress protein CsbD [Methylobacterium platani JCM 14648]OAS19421.1 general stress protein CsbD [Methylobacterium platani]